MSENKIIGEVEASYQTNIRVSLNNLGRGWYLDIRKYKDTEAYTGPTKKGITLHPETADEVFSLFEKGRDILTDDPDGYIPEKKETKLGGKMKKQTDLICPRCEAGKEQIHTFTTIKLSRMYLLCRCTSCGKEFLV